MRNVCIIKSRKYPIEEKDISDGGTLNVYMIARELICQGYHLDIFTRNEGGEEELTELPQMRVLRIPFVRSSSNDVLVRDYEEGKSFVENMVRHKEFKPSKYSCIHTHHWTSGILLESYIGSSIKLIHTPHLLASEKALHNGLALPIYVKLAEKTLIDRAVHVIVFSKSEEMAIRTMYNTHPGKIILAPNGIDDSFFRLPLFDLNTHSIFSVLSVGRICRQKGIDILLDTIEQVIKSGTFLSLRLVGDNYAELDIEKILEERIQKEPLLGVVERIGRVSHNSLLSLLRDSFVYVQPSRYESQGTALLEAMAAGRVVIASDLPAIREYIRHGENGLLIEPENPQALTDALYTVFANPERSLVLGQAARETARLYTWQRMLQAVLPLYKNLTKDGIIIWPQP